jgi:ubiquinone/menaquinone biosynthesis C-methylase UbiE
MKTTLLALACGAVIATGAWAAQEEPEHGSGHDATVHHEFDNAAKWAEQFDSRDRLEWQKPVIVMRVLGLAPDDVVADIGAGTGYFTHILSHELGPTGKIYAVDVEPEMLAWIEQREDLGPAPVETVLAKPDDPMLPEGALDVILVVNTWHHIDDRLHYLERLRRTLRPDGRLVIIDWHEGDLPMGPPKGHKLSREAVVDELTEAGWRLGSESVALPYQYFLIFYPSD